MCFAQNYIANVMICVSTFKVLETMPRSGAGRRGAEESGDEQILIPRLARPPYHVVYFYFFKLDFWYFVVSLLSSFRRLSADAAITSHDNATKNCYIIIIILHRRCRRRVRRFHVVLINLAPDQIILYIIAVAIAAPPPPPAPLCVCR